MPLPREYVSHNQIRLYCDCPKKYYYTYIAALPAAINEKIYLGAVFHSTAAEYLTRKIAQQDTSVLAMRDVYHQRFKELQQEQEIRWNGAKDKTRERGAALIHYFVNHIGPALRPLMIEKEIAVTIPDSQIRLKGVLDLVEENFAITDFKTATAKWPAKRALKSLQMVIYKYLFEQSFTASSGALQFLVVYAKNAANVRHQAIPVPVGNELTSAMLEIVNRVCAAIVRGEFQKNESYLCQHCEYKAACLSTGASG
jgi:hypothetical protein